MTLNSGSCVVLNKTCLYSFINDELKKSCIGKLSNNKKTRNCKNFLTTPSDHFISSPQKGGRQFSKIVGRPETSVGGLCQLKTELYKVRIFSMTYLESGSNSTAEQSLLGIFN